ncbi:MAG: polysaccharide deacetylase family protein [Candidatus Aminicenantes bacterium]|jgi:predicted glycoside hydrolase/deacetylase ChbG (UPF0249 family)
MENRKLAAAAFFLAAGFSVFSAAWSQDSLAKSEEKLLIIHADDVGMCHAVNEATIKALEEGIVTCGSIMVPCPWFLEIAEYCRKHPEADMGIHVTLTSEWKHYRWRPVSSTDKVPGLIDEEGYLWPSVLEVVLHASADEVETEIRAQVKRAIDFGIKPTHIDTHMGTVFASPEYFRAYCDVARDFGIPPMIVSPESKIVKQTIEANPVMAPVLETLKRIAREFPAVDELAEAKSKEVERRKEEYKAIIRNLKPGITQIIVHLSLGRPEIHGITSEWLARYNDYRIFTALEMKQFIKDQGVKLTGWRDLR